MEVRPERMERSWLWREGGMAPKRRSSCMVVRGGVRTWRVGRVVLLVDGWGGVAGGEMVRFECQCRLCRRADEDMVDGLLSHFEVGGM